MTQPHQEHNSLLATREFLKILSNAEDVIEKYKLSAVALLEHYPEKPKLDELYKGNTIEDLFGRSNPDEDNRPNKIVNDNQTWNTPGYKWKTEVEFVPNNADS